MSQLQKYRSRWVRPASHLGNTGRVARTWVFVFVIKVQVGWTCLQDTKRRSWGVDLCRVVWIWPFASREGEIGSCTLTNFCIYL